MRSTYKRIERSLLWATPFKRFIAHRYQFSFSPSQLSFINGKFLDSHKYQGISMEVGCFVGATTVFLNANYKYGVPKRTYYAIDTFSGFTEGDINYENHERNKNLTKIHDETLFNMNSIGRFRYTMNINGNDNVIPIKMDVNRISGLELNERLAFFLVDVDLYKPTLSTLRYVIPKMIRGGTLIVDDCISESDFDGSLQALSEACRDFGLTFEVTESKLGIIQF